MTAFDGRAGKAKRRRNWSDRYDDGKTDAAARDAGAEKTERNERTGESGAGMGAAAVMLVALLNAWAAVAAYHYFYAEPRMTRIGVVDLLAVVREKEAALTRAVSADNVSGREKEIAFAMAADFARRMPEALEQLSQECRCVILAGNAVAGRHNAVDLTPAFRQKVGL